MSTELSGALLAQEGRVLVCSMKLPRRRVLSRHNLWHLRTRHSSTAWEICCSSPRFRCSDVQETGYYFRKCILISNPHDARTSGPNFAGLLCFVGFDLVNWSMEGAAIPALTARHSLAVSCGRCTRLFSACRYIMTRCTSGM